MQVDRHVQTTRFGLQDMPGLASITVTFGEHGQAGMAALSEALGEYTTSSALYALANGLLDRKT